MRPGGALRRPAVQVNAAIAAGLSSLLHHYTCINATCVEHKAALFAPDDCATQVVVLSLGVTLIVMECCVMLLWADLTTRFSMLAPGAHVVCRPKSCPSSRNVSIGCTLRAATCDPGYIPRAGEHAPAWWALEGAQHDGGQQRMGLGLCTTCRVDRPLRSKHCTMCNRCAGMM